VISLANKVIWITGTSSGLGQAAAAAFCRAGWQVVSGARSFRGKEGPGKTGHALMLDVCDEGSVAAFCEKALALYGAPDALVCAAGILTLGPAETTSPGELKQVLDTNFLGAVRVCQQVLPLMRQNGCGKIALISSVNGLMPTPFQGAYVASKHALEGWSECLMLETRGQNIQICLVEPGDHAGGSQAYRNRAKKVNPLYQQAFEAGCAIITRDEAQGPSPESFGKKLVRAFNKKRLPARLRVTTLKETMAIVLHDLLPGRLFHSFLGKYYKV
jgi:NAD(P)-dependent dehydrogenase (short-subunit alcohol dehydrogenase family)